MTAVSSIHRSCGPFADPPLEPAVLLQEFCLQGGVILFFDRPARLITLNLIHNRKLLAEASLLPCCHNPHTPEGQGFITAICRSVMHEAEGPIRRPGIDSIYFPFPGNGGLMIDHSEKTYPYHQCCFCQTDIGYSLRRIVTNLCRTLRVLAIIRFRQGRTRLTSSNLRRVTACHRKTVGSNG
jgi:hypothetical protein